MPYYDDADPDWFEIADLRAQDRADRRYAAQLAAHPDPRDPDHPERPEPEEDEA